MLVATVSLADHSTAEVMTFQRDQVAAGGDEVTKLGARRGRPTVGSRWKAAGFEIQDYFGVQRIVELTMSSDGTHVAYVTEALSLKKNQVVRNAFVLAVEPEHIWRPSQVPVTDARRLAWVHGTHQLAFLSARAGEAQVFSYDTATGRVEQVTRSYDPVVRFRFSTSGNSVAYTTAVPRSGQSLYEQFRNADAGILIDSDTTLVHDFVDPTSSLYQLEHMLPTSSSVLWLSAGSSQQRPIFVPGEIRDFFWSSDAHALSVTYVAEETPPSVRRQVTTSIGIVDAGTGAFRVVAKGNLPTHSESGHRYGGGQWVPHEQKIFVWRDTETNAWEQGIGEWAIAEASGEVTGRTALTWHRANAYFGFVAHPVDESKILVEDTVNAVRSLFVWRPWEGKPSEIAGGLTGSSSLFQFTPNFDRVAFVNESFTRPPEIYIRYSGAPARQLTKLNLSAAKKALPRVKEMSWESTDGVTVRGWLLEPRTPQQQRPWPLVTLVHGGPHYAFPNAFAPYFLRRSWPYPFEAYATHGIAVFIPNYRGTGSFGKDFGTPRSIDGEPVDDIITGIEHLIDGGVADPARLGICGHSHGAWLGPLVMTRTSIFRASSFAEGAPNLFVNYDLMSGLMNREINDVFSGGSPYESPSLYVRQSPGLHFDEKLFTANLFEAGAWSEAIYMLAFAKASRRVKLPTETIFYPKTGHGIELPRLQKESAQRNLDWFRFWLQDYEDPHPTKVEQYRRWRRLRYLQCRDRPELCKHAQGSRLGPQRVTLPSPG